MPVSSVAPDRVDALGVLPAMRLFGPVLAAGSFVAALVLDRTSAAPTVAAIVATAGFVVWARWPRLGVFALSMAVVPPVLVAIASDALEPVLFQLCAAATLVGVLESSDLRFGSAAVVLLGSPALASAVGADISIGVWTLGVAVSLALTRVTRRQALLSIELAEARAELADQRVAEERRRIARDVHDSVGHGLAAMLLHITGARHVVRRDTEAADEALAEAEAVGRASMIELRRTLGVLRADDAPDSQRPAAPVPTATRLGELGIEVSGDLDRVDSVVGTSLHRVAEEAIANANHHADSIRSARLEVTDGDVILTVESVGRPRGADALGGDGPRYGIIGMNERMTAIGGHLEAGPTAAGWLVTAVAPLDAPTADPS